MRRAFIGLSTPIGYDYGNFASKAPADEASSPNPVLDSPFGLLLLFDELVFLTRSLCPENMRNLPYVSFLDESLLLPHLLTEEVEAAENAVWNAEFGTAISMRPYSDVIDAIGLPSDMNVDNHSHGLSLGALSRQANPSMSNLAIDMLVHAKLRDPTLELIANSRFHGAIEDTAIAPSHPQLAEVIAIEGIPNYLTSKGPYHPIIEDVRSNKYLSDFRHWIAQKPRNASASEVAAMKKDVEHALREAQETHFLRRLEPKRHFETIGKAMLGDALGVLCPFTGTLSAIMETTIDAANDKEQFWQGFLTSSRRTTRASIAK